MARQDEAGEQEDFRLSWKYWIGLLVGWVVANLLFDTLLPDFPPLWAALVIALLFGIFAIAFPLLWRETVVEMHPRRLFSHYRRTNTDDHHGRVVQTVYFCCGRGARSAETATATTIKTAATAPLHWSELEGVPQPTATAA